MIQTQELDKQEDVGSVNNFNYKNYTDSDISPLILAINLLGKNLVGCELGVGLGKSLMTLLHNCSLDKIYAIDHWKPYVDYIKEKPDGKPALVIDKKEQEFREWATKHKIKYSGCEKKVHLIIKDSMEALNEIPDYSLDFLFFDAMLNEEQTFQEGLAYYKKIKKGGYFLGHDADCNEQVIQPIKKIKTMYNNNQDIIIYANCFLFKID